MSYTPAPQEKKLKKAILMLANKNPKFLKLINVLQLECERPKSWEYYNTNDLNEMIKGNCEQTKLEI